MKFKIIFCFLLILGFEYGNCQTKKLLVYEDFGISFIPKKSLDTLSFDITEGFFKNSVIKIFLYEYGGKCLVRVYDKKNKILRVDGMYNSSTDTLKKYNYSKVMGKLKGNSVFKVRILEYLAPLKNGKWIYYNAKGKIDYETVYTFER
jgi:hypothetical protein